MENPLDAASREGLDPRRSAGVSDRSAKAKEKDAGSQRAARIAEYLTQEQQNADPLEANLATMNAEMMRLTGALGGDVERKLAAGSDPASLLPELGTYLKFVKQVAQFAQLPQRLKIGRAHLEAIRSAASGEISQELPK